MIARLTFLLQTSDNLYTSVCDIQCTIFNDLLRIRYFAGELFLCYFYQPSCSGPIPQYHTVGPIIIRAITAVYSGRCYMPIISSMHGWATLHAQVSLEVFLTLR